MSFPANETSVENGRPVELLHVAVGALNFYYTTSEIPITHNGQTYKPEPFSHPELKSTSEIAKSTLPIKVSAKSKVAELFRAFAPGGVVIATLYQYHIGDDESEFYVAWKGRIVNVNWTPPYAEISVENIYASLKRPGIPRKIGTQCPLPLYSEGTGMCNVNREDWREPQQVVSVDRRFVVLSNSTGKPDNWYAGGYIEWINPENNLSDKRMVRGSDGTTGVLTLTSNPMTLAVGQAVNAYPGCDHTLGNAGCSKFNNTINYGGQPYIPLKNSFTGDSSY